MIKPYYKNQSVTLYHGDCLELIPQFDPGSINAVITDPPYGIGECEWDVKIDCAALHAAMRTVSKRNAAKVLFSNMRFACRLIAGDEKAFRYDLVWYKGKNSSPADAKRKPLRCHENILVFYDAIPVYNPQMWHSKPYTMSKAARAAGRRFATLGEHEPTVAKTSRYPRSIIYQSCSYDSKGFGVYDLGNHPTQKPVALMEWLIKTYSNSGDMVLDPFAGSGSTGIAAMRTGRNAVLIELEERFCELAAKRLEKEATA